MIAFAYRTRLASFHRSFYYFNPRFKLKRRYGKSIGFRIMACYCAGMMPAFIS